MAKIAKTFVRNSRGLEVLSNRCAILLLWLFLSTVACSDKHSDYQIDYTLDRGLNGEPESLDPHQFSSNQSASVLRDIGEGLVRYDSLGALVAGVAEDWSISDDGLDYVFILRADARWSTGDDLIAADFVNAYRELVTPSFAAVNANNAEHIQNSKAILNGSLSPESLGVFADSPKMLRIHLEQPTPYFLELLAHPSMFPKHSTTNPLAVGEPNSLEVTNGAYVLSERILGSRLSLSKNDKYWGHESVEIETVNYHVLEESAELSRYRAMDLDVTENVPSTHFEFAQKEFPEELRVAPFLGVYYYGFNLTNSVFSDRESLRRALSLAIDRETLVDKIIGRGEVEAFGWVPPGFPNYESQSLSDRAIGQLEREKLARELYLQNGYGENNPLRFELRYNTSDVQQRIALAIRAMWTDVLGAEVILVSEEYKVLVSNIQEAQITEVFRLSWTGDYNDPQTFLKLFESDNSSNYTGYSSPLFDSIMQEASTETDPQLRKMLLEKAEVALLEDHPVIPLYFYVSKHLVSERIVGWQDNLLDIHPSQYLSFLN